MIIPYSAISNFANLESGSVFSIFYPLVTLDSTFLSGSAFTIYVSTSWIFDTGGLCLHRAQIVYSFTLGNFSYVCLQAVQENFPVYFQIVLVLQSGKTEFGFTISFINESNWKALDVY